MYFVLISKCGNYEAISTDRTEDIYPTCGFRLTNYSFVSAAKGNNLVKMKEVVM
jgi:hypothetical protein